eukprot:gnl/Spiro4/26693_TR13258_c0_g1_i1.p1 gnl/Spiro4/26693_TR13258_c0_g1~~gnl/Spiro4/26693_TR13258_c0_g1_i1.p1  ORF type:complete len:392 (-),score=20.66 gnl/Spiro4/26693_TR13258_c0_g1_i1:67-1242(-)
MLRRFAFLFSKRSFVCRDSPLSMKGNGLEISRDELSVGRAGQTPLLTLYALPGYVSTLFLCKYNTDKDCGGGSRWLLLDTGCFGDAHRVKFFLEHMRQKERPHSGPDEAPVSLSSQLRLVVSTHTHPDHSQAAHHFQKWNIPVAMPRNYSDLYSGFRGQTQAWIDCVLAQVVAFRLGRVPELLRTFRGTPDRMLVDGESLSPHFPDWTVLHIPGHTTHMCALYHRDARILYASDMLIVTGSGSFWPPVPLDIRYAYQHSVDRLRQIPVRILLLAHGGIIDVDQVGGWNRILDAVLERSNKSSWLLNVLGASVSTANDKFTPEHLPNPNVFEVLNGTPGEVVTDYVYSYNSGGPQNGSGSGTNDGRSPSGSGTSDVRSPSGSGSSNSSRWLH